MYDLSDDEDAKRTTSQSRLLYRYPSADAHGCAGRDRDNFHIQGDLADTRYHYTHGWVLQHAVVYHIYAVSYKFVLYRETIANLAGCIVFSFVIGLARLLYTIYIILLLSLSLYYCPESLLCMCACAFQSCSVVTRGELHTAAAIAKK